MRCAIYTRVSTDEQAKQEYSSLERQKEVCEHYIEIHKDDGWQVVGGFTTTLATQEKMWTGQGFKICWKR